LWRADGQAVSNCRGRLNRTREWNRPILVEWNHYIPFHFVPEPNTPLKQSILSPCLGGVLARTVPPAACRATRRLHSPRTLKSTDRFRPIDRNRLTASLASRGHVAKIETMCFGFRGVLSPPPLLFILDQIDRYNYNTSLVNVRDRYRF
jgi:hypothetical protein